MTAPKKSTVETAIFIFVGDKTRPLSSQIFNILSKSFIHFSLKKNAVRIYQPNGNNQPIHRVLLGPKDCSHGIDSSSIAIFDGNPGFLINFKISLPSILLMIVFMPGSMVVHEFTSYLSSYLCLLLLGRIDNFEKAIGHVSE
ncbi:hypothetical protein Tco_0643311 [Tanacetum coccineum]